MSAPQPGEDAWRASRGAGSPSAPLGAPRTVVIDYGAGNLHSIARALSRAGLQPTIAAGPGEAAGAELLVLPGQGRFGQVARAFAASGFEPLVRDHIAAGGPFLGVCVGLQLLLERSEEDPEVPGLGIVKGAVRRFTGAVRVPQMGWNTVRAIGSPALFAGVPDGAHVYFANSYYALPEGEGATAPGTLTRYGDVEFRSAFSLGNLHATQFHPEKSQAVGLRVLENLKRLLSRSVAA